MIQKRKEKLEPHTHCDYCESYIPLKRDVLRNVVWINIDIHFRKRFIFQKYHLCDKCIKKLKGIYGDRRDKYRESERVFLKRVFGFWD